MGRSSWGSCWAGRQGGATAVELAFVLPVLFLLFYGILSYGFIFLMRMGLQHAAEDAARAALRAPAGVCAEPCDTDARRRFQIGARLEAAQTVARDQAQWMARSGEAALQVTSRISRSCNPAEAGCTGELEAVSCSAASCPVGGAMPDCGAGLVDACQVVVEVRYDYAQAPLIPMIAGLGLLMPDRLTGQARMLLDGRAL